MRSLSISRKHRDLAHAQSRAIGDRQCRLVLEAGGRVEQARHLVAAQHHRQVAGPAHPNQLAGQIGSVEGIGEEEPQRRDDAVQGRHRNAGLALGELELAHILGGRRVQRSPQERGEAPHIADVVALRRHREAAHVHVVDQLLAQRADRGVGKHRGHCLAPRMKEPKRNARTARSSIEP
jgi:hypothetical protein